MAQTEKTQVGSMQKECDLSHQTTTDDATINCQCVAVITMKQFVEVSVQLK